MEEAPFPQTIGNYQLKDKLGCGAFSSVIQAIDTRTQIPVAIKVIDKTRVNIQTLRREEDLLMRLDHPFCVSFYEFLEDEHYYYLVMEYVEGRTIFKLINAKGALPEWLCRHVFCQLICALDYLHTTLKCVHRDIKAENIMLDHSGNIKLIDFGLSNIFESSNTLLSTVVGSPAYAPPEMFNGQKYNANADLWSAGVVLYAMSVGKLPFQDPCFKSLVQKITTLEPEYPEEMSPLLVDLLHRMLMKDFNCRMSIAKIRDHPWFIKYRYSPIMKADYGIDQHFRIHVNDDGDEDVIKKLQDLNINGIQLMKLARNNIFTTEVAPFRIVHRYIIKQKMKGMYKQAQEDEGKESSKKFTLSLPPPAQKLATPSFLSSQRDPFIGRRRSMIGMRHIIPIPESHKPIVEDDSISVTKSVKSVPSLKIPSPCKLAALQTFAQIANLDALKKQFIATTFETPDASNNGL